MKRIVLSGGMAALGLVIGLTALPAQAAPAQPVALPPPAATTAQPDKADAPYLIKVGDMQCPVIPKGSSLSAKTQRLFDTLTSACLMKASGLMTDIEFEGIRDEVAGMLTQQIMNDVTEASMESTQPLASNP